MRWRVALLAVMTAAVAACGEDAAGPTVERGQVAGTYDLTVLIFNPQGSLPEKSILARLTPADRPEFNVSANGNDAQFVYRDPATQLVTVADATYRLREFGIEVTFDNAADAERILLPRRLNLTLSTDAATLSFEGEVSVQRARLQQLVPDWADEPLVNPVPGQLEVAFTRRPVEE